MAGGERQRTVLTPAGHAAEHELLVTAEYHIWPETETLHHAGTKAFEQRIRAVEQGQHLRDLHLVFQIDRDNGAAARGGTFRHLVGPHQRDDLRAHIREQHRGERPRADAGEFDDAEAGQRSAGSDGGGFGCCMILHFGCPVFVFVIIGDIRLAENAHRERLSCGKLSSLLRGFARGFCLHRARIAMCSRLAKYYAQIVRGHLNHLRRRQATGRRKRRGGIKIAQAPVRIAQFKAGIKGFVAVGGLDAAAAIRAIEDKAALPARGFWPRRA